MTLKIQKRFATKNGKICNIKCEKNLELKIQKLKKF